MGLFPTRLPCGVTVWGHNGRIPGSYVRTAATADGRRVLTFRVNTDTLAAAPGPPLERSVLEAEFCPRGGAAVHSGTMSGAPSRAASAVWSSGWRCDSRSASTRFS